MCWSTGNYLVDLISHQYVFALIYMSRFKDADEIQRPISSMAERLRDDKSLAYAMAGALLTIVYVALVGAKRIPALVACVRQNPYYDSNGHFIGRAEMILGLFYKTKRKRDLALRHLGEARRISAQFGETPMLAKIDAALAELR